MIDRKTLNVYQYIAPLILTPLSFYLWWSLYRDWYLATLVWGIPILYAYIVPAVGTNVLKVWEFDTRFRLGRFRVHHGFVFGSATAMIAWLCHVTLWSGLAQDWQTIVNHALVMMLVLGVINIVYDIAAIRAGLLKVYNQPWSEGRSATAITMDYAPWFFGGFGLVYGAGISGAEYLYANGNFTGGAFAWYFPSLLVVTIVVPVISYRQWSFRQHGHSGCRPVARTDTAQVSATVRDPECPENI